MNIEGATAAVISLADKIGQGTVQASHWIGRNVKVLGHKTIDAGSELISDAGVSYVIDEVATFITTSVSITFTAVLAGADGNDDPNISLIFVSPITGVDTEVIVDGTGIVNGLDEETSDELRERALTRKRQSPYGGADFDYEEWSKEVAGVTRAWAFTNWQGPNTVGVAFVRDNDDPIIPTETQKEAVKSHIEEHTNPLTGVIIGKPTGATLYMINASEYTQNFSIAIVPNTAAVKASILTQLTDYIITMGPGISNYRAGMNKAVGAAAGLTAFEITLPAADVGYNSDQIPVMGTITWSDYQ